MSTAPEEVRTRPTQTSEPEFWAGPSFFWSTARFGRWQLLAGGWRYRCTAWERRFADAGLAEVDMAGTPWGWQARVLAGPGAARRAASEELDVILDGPDADFTAMPGLVEALHEVLGEQAAAELIALPPLGSTSVTQNRSLLPESATGLRVADLRWSSLPYGHSQQDRPVQYASRWLRLAATDKAVVSLWGPLDGRWEPEHIRWPHHAVPSRRVDSLKLAARPAPVAARLAAVLADCLEHEQYYLDTWQMELEAWEAAVYASLADGEAVLRGVDLSDPVRERAGRLATFLSRTQFDLRALGRRAQVESLFDHPEVRAVVDDGLAAARTTQAENQRLRREAFSLLTSVAAGEQLQASRDQADAAQAAQRATESLQQTVTGVTALLLAPTVVVGVFGANVAQFAPGTKGTLLQLAEWAVLAAGVSMSVLWWRNPPRVARPPLWIALNLLLLALIVGGAVLLADGRAGAALLWSGTVTAWLAAALLAHRQPAFLRRRAP